MSARAPQLPIALVGETLLGACSFVRLLDAGELLTGTPTVEEITTADLTIASATVNNVALVVNGEAAAVGQAVQWAMSGQVAGTRYTLRVTCSTDSVPAQTRIGIVSFRAAAAA